MVYSFICPFEDDNAILYVEAESEETGADMLLAAAKDHIEHNHPEIAISDMELKEMITARMYEGEPPGHPGSAMKNGGMNGIEIPQEAKETTTED